MKALNKATKILARILEICHWVGAGIMAVLFVCCLVAKDLAVQMIAGDLGEEDVLYGFHFTLTNAAGDLSLPAMAVFAFAGVLLLGLMAMVFRNVYLIIKTSEGETWFSQGATPFQPDVVRMLREIGIFTIAVPVVELVMSIAGRIVVGPEFAETSVDLRGFVLGFLVLWLTQAFTYGASLEKDAEGLI